MTKVIKIDENTNAFITKNGSVQIRQTDDGVSNILTTVEKLKELINKL